MKILLVHPGYSFPRHFNNLEACVQLLDSVYDVQCDALVCGKAVNACGFRTGKSEWVPDEVVHNWQEPCNSCQQKLLTRLGSFCNSVIGLSDLVSDEDRILIDSVVANLPNPMNVVDLLNLEFRGVNVGKDIWQSIQYYLRMGGLGKIFFPPGSIAYEYLRSGLIFACGMQKLFKNSKYDLVLENEIAYVDWGIAAKFALKEGMPVLRQGNYYLGHQHLTLRLYKSFKEFVTEHPLHPIQEEVNFLDDDNIRRTLAKSGKQDILRWMTKEEAGATGKISSLCKEWFRPGRKTVVVFTNLCYDSSIAYGDRIFPTFEDWLTKTYEVALSTNAVDWIFRIHPAEKKSMLNKHANTLIHLKRLKARYPCKHIRIMDSSVGLRSYDLIPFIHAGVTTLGTVGYELAAFGVPCVLAVRGGYCGLDFAVSPASISEYADTLRRVAGIAPLTPRQEELALAYAGLVFSPNRFLDVSGLFRNEDSSDKFIDRGRLEKWVSQEHNRNYIQNKLSSKVQNRVETCIPAGRKNEMQSLSNGNRNEKPSIRGRVLILLTNPRSGSTWFTDAIRCHPAVEFLPTAVICRRLGLNPNLYGRYPRDMSNRPDANQEIEITEGKWASVPTFEIPLLIDKSPERFFQQVYAIEKIHPECFDYDVHSFLQRIRIMEDNGLEVKLIYQVRDPEASINSFMNYQERNSTWYPETKNNVLADYMRKTYEAILEVARRKPGLIVDYGQIAADLSSSLQRAYGYLWPGLSPEESDYLFQISHAATAATARDKRVMAVNSSFLGSEPGPVRGSADKYRAFFVRYQADIESCYKNYRHLLALAETQYQSRNQIEIDKGSQQQKIWLVVHEILESELLDIKKRLDFYAPGLPPQMLNVVSKLPARAVLSTEPVLLFGDARLLPDSVRNDRSRFFDIDYRRNPTDGWEWSRLANCLAEYKPDIGKSKERFKRYIDKLRQKDLKRAYLFGTGPSLEKAIERDFSDGYRIVCNTIVRDRQLWNHIKPHFIVAGDAIYHFGHTEFARTFRKDLKARLRETETFFVYPELFDSIVQRECAEFSDRLIPVPKGSAQKVNIDLTQNFELPGLHNVLGLLFLPLGCTMSRHVYLWGFDGRAPGDKLFWSNSRKHSYPELIPELQKAHPRFFDHFIPKDDSNKYIKLAFGNLLENCLTAAESEGWQFVMMHHSWTPTLAKRCIKEITSLDKEKLLTHQKGNTSDSDFSAIFGEHKICPNPFLALEIHTDGNVSVCCTARLNKGCEFVGNILYEPLDEIWNSEKIQLFREVMYTAQYGKTCKPFCPQLIALKKGQTPLWYSHLCDAETCGEIAGKKIVLNSPYRAVSVASDGSCNLHCIMCRNDKKLRPTELEKLVNQKLYSQILDNISKIRFLELTGTGEPFFNKSVSDFIEQLKNKDTHNLVIRFITNGQLLTEERWQQIEALNAKELRISVSIDAASKEIYESIRRGAKWEMLLRNMKMLSEKRAKGKLDRLETSLCVMKRNIHEMVPFIELCRAWNCDKIELQRIFGTIAGDENIFDNEDTSCLETLSAVLQDPRFDEKWIAASSLLPYRNYSAERNILPETPVGQMESGLTVASNALMQPGRLSKEFSERACDKVS